MTSSHRYWIAIHPDIRKPIGGVKQIHRFAEALSACGRQVTLIQENADFHPGWFESQVSTISHAEWKQRHDLTPLTDVVVLPETFVPAIPRYGPGLPKLIFNQNGSYSFGGFNPRDGFPATPNPVLELYKHPEIVHTLCVSKHDQRLLVSGFGLGDHKVSRLINAIETTIFRPAGSKKHIIAYMPRKNSRDAAIVTTMMQKQPWFKDWELQPIHGLPQPKVATILQQSIAFLAFGHPEGFGLPLAEAAACGCALIGYSGLGGRELLELAEENQVGWQVEFGDWQGFLSGAEVLTQRVQQQPKKLVTQLQDLSTQVRDNYAFQAMINSVAKALPRWESQLPV